MRRPIVKCYLLTMTCYGTHKLIAAVVTHPRPEQCGPVSIVMHEEGLIKPLLPRRNYWQLIVLAK